MLALKFTKVVVPSIKSKIRGIQKQFCGCSCHSALLSTSNLTHGSLQQFARQSVVVRWRKFFLVITNNWANQLAIELIATQNSM